MTGSAQDQDSIESCEEYWNNANRSCNSYLPYKNADIVFVLLWHYGDNSAFGVQRVYENEIRAKADLELLQTVESSKTFQLVEMTIIR